LNTELEQTKRRFVTINDPHIKNNNNYWIYQKGLALQEAEQPKGNITNIFVRNPEAKSTFVATCWPGLSSWIDYLNTNAADFWGSLYLPENFPGTNHLYGTWNDMNEPSVFVDHGGW
jgi:mannosyl-oligosaccharide alpha-1,3-glucosidase